jgi:hypothetical protein
VFWVALASDSTPKEALFLVLDSRSAAPPVRQEEENFKEVVFFLVFWVALASDSIPSREALFLEPDSRSVVPPVRPPVKQRVEVSFQMSWVRLAFNVQRATHAEGKIKLIFLNDILSITYNVRHQRKN